MEPKNKREEISQLIKDAWARGDPTGWFDAVYAGAENGELAVPWAYMKPNPDMMSWLERESFDGAGKRALVIGCGLGDDAEALAALGCDVVAFDVSPTAVEWCKRRFPESAVNYQSVDLFAAPENWRESFDFVLESRTVQSLPVDLCESALATIASFVALGGTLLVLCHGRDAEVEPRGIPWPLSRDDLGALIARGLTEIDFEDYVTDDVRRFRVSYRRPVSS